MSGTLTFVPLKGLCNRIRAISSAKKLADDLGSALQVYWMKDDGLETEFTDLFEELEDIAFYDHSQKSYLSQKIIQAIKLTNTKFTPIRKLAERRYDFIFPWMDHGELEDNKVIESMRGKRVLISSFNKFYQPEEIGFSMFTPLKHIGEAIDEFSGKHINEHTVGVHIRRGDNVKAMAKSPTERYVRLMDYYVQTNDRTNFFLSTDDPETETLLVKRYREKICVREKEFSRVTTSGMQSAIVDLHLLSRTKEVLGSYWSSFTLTASEMGNIPYQIVGEESTN